LRTIDDITTPLRNWSGMARYSAFLGLQVEVQYRAGDILLPASGTFVGDTGRSIFLEQNFEQRGQHRNFRWEIPYQYIVRLARKTEPETPAVKEKPVESQLSSEEPVQETDSKAEREKAAPENAATAAAGVGSNVTVIFARPQRSNA
jgi:hypothetical protein